MTRFPIMLIIFSGALILSLNMGVRQSLGLFIPDMMSGLGLPLGTFGLAFAIQNLLWGAASPVAGIFADRYGTTKTVILGSFLYIAGLVLMAYSTTAWMFHGSIGIIMGLGVSATTFPVVLGAIGRKVTAEKRTFALSIASAGGSVGQFVMAPVSTEFIASFGWVNALLVISVICALMVPAGMTLTGKAENRTSELSMKQTLSEAVANKGYQLLFVGFFVCGFHVAFVAVHLPNLVALCGLDYSVASNSLALIGLFNIVGTLLAGWLGGRYRQSWLLSSIYVLRALLCIFFVLSPKTVELFMFFSVMMGMLWLSTVPLTSGVIARLFGPQYMATLFGLVMLSHQIGAFLGSWLAGVIFDATGSYDLVWLIGAGLGIFAAVVHFPIREHQQPQVALA